jgi:hypothetical protein
MAFEKASAVLLIVGLMATKSLCTLRTCAVWRWNRFIIAFFTFSWLCVASSTIVTATLSTKSLQVETSSYCTVIIVEGRLIPLPLILTVVNHTLIVIAITYGVCKNTMHEDLTFRHGIMLMLGKSLPTFSKALLHDSQISYILIAVVSVIALILAENWHDYQPSPFGMTAAMAPYLALVTILTGRVHRNTKLGLYNMVSLQSNDRKSQPHAAAYIMLPPGNSLPAAKPIPIAVSESNVDEYRSDYSTRRSRGSVNSLDFGAIYSRLQKGWRSPILEI